MVWEGAGAQSPSPDPINVEDLRTEELVLGKPGGLRHGASTTEEPSQWGRMLTDCVVLIQERPE